MKLIRNHSTQVALILFFVFSITLFSSCAYEATPFRYAETEQEFKELPHGREIFLSKHNGSTQKLRLKKINQDLLRGKDNHKQIVEISLSEIEYTSGPLPYKNTRAEIGKKDGTIYQLKSVDIYQDTLIGEDNQKQIVEVPIFEIEYIAVKKPTTLGWILITAAGTVVFILFLDWYIDLHREVF